MARLKQTIVGVNMSSIALSAAPQQFKQVWLHSVCTIIPTVYISVSILYCSPFILRSFSVHSPFVLRSFSVRSPFVLRSFSVRSPFVLRSFSVRSPFVLRSFSVHSPFVLRSFSVRESENERRTKRDVTITHRCWNEGTAKHKQETNNPEA